jgi:hypothetical protein
LDSTVASAHGVLVWAVSMVFAAVFSVALAFAGLNFIANAVRAAGITNLLSFSAGGGSLSTSSAASTASTSGWVGFIILLLALIAAIVGAIVGNNGRSVEPTTR